MVTRPNMIAASTLLASLVGALSSLVAGLAISETDHDLGLPNGHQRRQSDHIQVFCRNENDVPIFTYGDQDTGGPGLLIWNYDSTPHSGIGGTMYMLYESDHDFVPYKHVIIPPLSSAFITVCPTFEGRIVRGDWTYLDGQKHMLGTWVEVSYTPEGMIYGDISLLEGNDGAAMIESMDGYQNSRGFTFDLLEHAPGDAWAQKTTGSWCLDKIVGQDANYAAWAWQSQFLDPWNVYLSNEVNPVINSVNGRFQITFYKGAI